MFRQHKYLKSALRRIFKFLSKVDKKFQNLKVYRRLLKRGYFGLNQIDKVLEKHLFFPNGYYVDLGANDGVTQSNTLYLEKYYNWKGLLIEPHPSTFAHLKEARSVRNSFLETACVSSTYPLHHCELWYSNLMSTVNDSVANPSAYDHAKSGQRFLENTEMKKFSAQAMTLTEAMSIANSPTTIDFLNLDVENYELEVLDGINFEIYTFRFILVETVKHKEVHTFLVNRNYKLLEKISVHDYLYRYAPLVIN